MGDTVDETRQRGLANIQAIRARMHPSPTQASDVVPATPTDELDDPAAMAAAMAVGAERDRLERRVADLELQVRQLRAVLGRVLQEVAGVMNAPDRNDPAGSQIQPAGVTPSRAPACSAFGVTAPA
jgi:hypothetical protein